jgi:hypothetical protein
LWALTEVPPVVLWFLFSWTLVLWQIIVGNPFHDVVSGCFYLIYIHS